MLHYLNVHDEDDETPCHVSREDLEISEFTDDSNIITCYVCLENLDEQWEETMRDIFKSPVGMTDEERECMGFIWDIEDEVE